MARAAGRAGIGPDGPAPRPERDAVIHIDRYAGAAGKAQLAVGREAAIAFG